MPRSPRGIRMESFFIADGFVIVVPFRLRLSPISTSWIRASMPLRGAGAIHGEVIPSRSVWKSTIELRKQSVTSSDCRLCIRTDSLDKCVAFPHLDREN